MILAVLTMWVFGIFILLPTIAGLLAIAAMSYALGSEDDGEA